MRWVGQPIRIIVLISGSLFTVEAHSGDSNSRVVIFTRWQGSWVLTYLGVAISSLEYHEGEH